MNEPNADEGLRSAATAYVHAVVTKGMDIEAKVRLIVTMNVLEMCSSLLTMCISRDLTISMKSLSPKSPLARLRRFGTSQREQSGEHHDTRRGIVVPGERVVASSHADDFVGDKFQVRARACSRLCLSSPRTPGTSNRWPALMNTEQPALTVACQAVVARGTFPTEHIEGLDWNDGMNALTHEIEEDVFNLQPSSTHNFET